MNEKMCVIIKKQVCAAENKSIELPLQQNIEKVCLIKY